uniref:Reverse transcriptase domain-containing protein n=1 Tax=Scophthalmus maximus TaxID=52904 RepID=A0A8D3C086_SCOMX
MEQRTSSLPLQGSWRGAWEYAHPVYMCFVYLEKAYDRVPREILWEVLREYGVRGSLLGAIQSLYTQSNSCVRVLGSKSDSFPVGVGLRQGCALSPILFVIFMDRISRRSRGGVGLQLGGLGISSLLFADDVVLMEPSVCDLQHSLDQFAAECGAVGMRISTSKSEAMVLSRKPVDCLLPVGNEPLPQVKEFKYLGVLFASEGTMEREIGRRIGAAGVVLHSLCRTVVTKREAKLSIYRSIFVPTLTYGHEGWVVTEKTRSRVQAAEMGFLRKVAGVTYGHEGWVVTEKTRSRVQAAEMGFLRKVAGVSLRDRVRSSVIREELGVEPLLLCVERSQLRWFGHLVRMPPGRLPWEVFQARPAGKRPRGRPRTRWRDYISTLAWERLWIPQSDLVNVAWEREVWGPLLKLLPPRPDHG